MISEVTKRRTVAIAALGCKVNQAEAEEWSREFTRLGFDVVGFESQAEVYLLNTCTVTHVADRKSRQLLRQARRQSPRALVMATGCYASVAQSDLEHLPEVDLVVSEKRSEILAAAVLDALAKKRIKQLLTEEDNPVQRSQPSRTRSNIKIGDGCDRFCAFCIVPYARGRQRSIPVSQIVANVQEAVAAGCREVVLTAVNLGAYGSDLDPPQTLQGAIAAVLSETSVERIRVSSIEPEDFAVDLLELWQDYPRRLCRHFHLPLQSGCEATLKRMRRRYSVNQYCELVESVRSFVPGAAVTTDIMVGFPGETEAEFAESYSYAKLIGFAQMHVFKYSRRQGTSAAGLPNQVPHSDKRERSDAMLQLAQVSAQAFRTPMIGQTVDVLYESPVPHSRTRLWEGLTDNYVRVVAESSRSLANQLYPTYVRAVGSRWLEGELMAMSPISTLEVEDGRVPILRNCWWSDQCQRGLP